MIVRVYGRYYVANPINGIKNYIEHYEDDFVIDDTSYTITDLLESLINDGITVEAIYHNEKCLFCKMSFIVWFDNGAVLEFENPQTWKHVFKTSKLFANAENCRGDIYKYVNGVPVKVKQIGRN